MLEHSEARGPEFETLPPCPLWSGVTVFIIHIEPQVPRGLKPPPLSGLWSWLNGIMYIYRFTQNLAKVGPQEASYWHQKKHARDVKYRGRAYQWTEDNHAEWRTAHIQACATCRDPKGCSAWYPPPSRPFCSTPKEGHLRKSQTLHLSAQHQNHWLLLD